MKCKITTLVFLLISSICFSQEVCDNGIDDDADGRIDLNDSDCACTSVSGTNTIASYLPNPSFEQSTLCPTGPSQLAYSDVWEQCTNTTADFINTCGYVPNAITEAGLLPFPQGQAIAGAIFSKDWKEYLGAGLTQPMLAGNTYQITLDIASLPVDGDGKTCNNGVITYGAVDVTIFGASSATALPVDTSGSPMVDSQWTVLGSAQYLPVSTWGQLTIVFTPTININAVMLGAPEVLPAEYDSATCYPYFLMDNLTLNEAENFGPAIQSYGNYCAGDLVLSLPSQTSLSTTQPSYQWYKNGIAIAGATSTSYAVSNAAPQDKIAAKLSVGPACYITPQYTITATMEMPEVAVVQPTCATATGTITVVSPAALYSFNNGQTWTTQNTAEALTGGNYLIKVKSAANCESAAYPVTISVEAIPAPQVTSVTYCQHSIATALTADGSNLLWYAEAEGGTGRQEAPIPSTAHVGTTTYYVSQSLNDCESPRAQLSVVISAGVNAPVVDEAVYYCQFSESNPLSATGVNLQWYTAATGGAGSSIAPVPSTSVAGTMNYYVSQTVNGCESNRAVIAVIILTAPSVPVAQPDYTFYQDDSAEALTAVGENVSWYNANGEFLPAAPRPDTYNTGVQKYYVTQSIDGCESKAVEIIVEVLPVKEDAIVKVSFPKFFTPNGDGQNEVWNMSKNSAVANAEITIYDRNGQLIKQVKAGEQGWDGTFNGRALPASDYWFQATYTEAGVQKEYVSHFSLVR